MVANVIGDISKNGRSTHGLLTSYDDEKIAMFCSSTSSQVRVVRVGKIPPVRFKSGEIMRSRPMKAGLVKSLAD